jgi:phosphate transport system permease protein
MISYQKFRIVSDKLIHVSIYVCSFLALIPFVSILWFFLKKGIKHFNLDFFIQTSPNLTDAMLANLGGETIPGGIVNGIFGSFLIVSIAIIIAIPLGIATGLYSYEKQKNKFAIFIQYINAIFYGMPSIIVGICAYITIVKTLHGFSALAGGVSLAVIILPIIGRSTRETLNSLPAHLKESGLALGGSYTGVMLKIILPTAKGRLITGTLIAISRALSETAPLIVVALGSSAINWNILSPTSTVSMLIWDFFNNPNMVDLVWSASLFLFIIVLTSNMIAKRIGWRWKSMVIYE